MQIYNLLKVKNDRPSKFSNLSNWKEEAWKKIRALFRLLLSNCLNWKIYCDDHSSLSSTTAVQKWIISYTSHYIIYCRHPVSMLTICHVRFFICRRLFYNWIIKINRIIIADGCKRAHTKTNKIFTCISKKRLSWIHTCVEIALAIFCLQFKKIFISKERLYWIHTTCFGNILFTI